MAELAKYKNWIIGIIIIVLSFYYVKWRIDKHSSLQRQFQKKEKELEKGVETIKRWRKVVNEAETLEKKIFFKSDFNFRNFIENTAKENNINLDFIKPSYNNEDNYIVITLAIAFSSPYKNFMNFISQCEKKSVLIENLGISSHRDKRVVTLNIKGYVKKNTEGNE